MDLDLLKKLSNADGIASNEQEVRDIMVKVCKEYSTDILYDNLGSVIFEKKGLQCGPKIMIAAHMDEVGFMVRSISKEGLIFLMEVGGVKELAKYMQPVRITTSENKKINGIINATYDNGTSKDLYVDIGATTDKEVYDLGIEIGDMVTYTTEFESLKVHDIACGKAFDDRLGCYVMAEVIKRLKDIEHPNSVYMAATSSEEVGIRGAKTSAYKINPDVVFVIDVACFSNEFVRNHTNKRQIGKGVMLTNFDRTLVPNRKMLKVVKEAAKEKNFNLQLDMFNKGGTDGGEAHKINEGKPTVVTCLPVRYGHCPFSIVNVKDLEECIDLYVEIIKNFDMETYKDTINFKGVEVI
ncbi:Putative aminopeptidase FrvX [Clostridium cavendishii DSM 21758]|uniref:Putative aminopeptidase FrvX n=1 Tax=Clostridium cavendishii DSM 21758 TaxID=1121302 RepID=A0A1M6SIT5_9CLOT|nr:aminopeptidase [Clostridium cavendishii]SHK44577.1 Putative aminopeptidase FrvX [Clostridium cavendishii DSM 21758]